MAIKPLTSDRFDFDDATDAIEFYFTKGWTDGLPVVPPTPGKVAGFLNAAGRSPSEILCTEPTKGRVITAEKVAINAVMAGCLPEYFPVVAAAVEAMSEPEFNLHGITASTAGAAVLALVNGPIANELHLNSGVSLFGPGHRANATIGRALRLVIINGSGSVSGEIDKATIGHPGKYTWCIAEAEEVSPWDPLHVERGSPDDHSAVTVFAGLSPIQAAFHESGRPEEILTSFTNALFASGQEQEEVVIVICPEHMGYIRSSGWSKDDVRSFLFESTQRKVADWTGSGAFPGGPPQDPDVLYRVAKRPESFTLLVGGGAAGAFSSIIPLWGGGAGSRSVTKDISVHR